MSVSMMSMEHIINKFHYVYSSSVSDKIEIKIGTLEGMRPKPEYEKLLTDPMLKYSGLCEGGCSDLMVVCQIFDQGEPLALPVATSYKAFTNRWNWNEWLTLPVQFNDLPRTANLALTVYDCIGPDKLSAVGGTTISLFSKHGLFRQGILDLRVWPGVEADGRPSSTTPGKVKDHGKEQMQRLSKLAKKHRNGHITKVDWLDRLTFRELEQINEKEKRSSEYLYLMIEFATLHIDDIPHNIIYFEENSEEEVFAKEKTDIVTVPDLEILKENLVESKHHKLARSLRSGHCDKDAKPNAVVRDILKTIVAYPPTKHLSNEEQDHVWKFRFYLSNQKKALTKFLKCVNWSQPNEVQQALHMMCIWAPMDVEDALELLCSNFTHATVRKYAISRLQQAPDDDVILYLLQLVQALKYENFKNIQKGFARLSPGCELPYSAADTETQTERRDSKKGSPVVTKEYTNRGSISYHNSSNPIRSQFSTTNVAENLDTLGNDSTSVSDSFLLNMNLMTNSANTETLHNELFDDEDVMDLATFLIQRTKNNCALANYFYWYLLLECEDREPTLKQDVVVREMYLTVMKTFMQTLAQGGQEMQNRRHILSKQQKFIDKLVKLVRTVSRERGDRKKKTEKLRQLLADPDSFKFDFTNFDPIPFPLDPRVTIKGIVPEKSSLFKSALMPCKLYFQTDDDREYAAIFKYGDDLRQDQLVLQMITLMDKLLRKENLDLKLTPYRVLATSTKHGFVQFIESITVADALATEGSIQNYFKKHHPQENSAYGIAPDIMDTYVRSCAGYCVITYLLGVGDRHLDNLLLTPCGKLFHIDFGYILGRDPKPLPPPMRLSKEMVEAMGGIGSEQYQEFRKQCYTAFLHLRRHANLMLNLFALMVDASIPDIALEPDKAVRKVQDKLRLELSEEEAVHYIQHLIDSSVSAVMPVIVEQFHKFTQLIRK